MLELRNKIEKIRTISECEIRMPVIKKKTENSLKKKFRNSPFCCLSHFSRDPVYYVLYSAHQLQR